MRPTVRRIVLSLAVVAAVPTVMAAPAVGGTCVPALRTEAGTCAKPVPTAPLTRAQKADDARMQASYQRVLAWLGSGSRGSSHPPDDAAPARRAYALPEIENMRIFKEGEGNGKKSWTCGPSATRNVIAALYKRKTGKYRDLTEQYFERIEGTTRAGTARANIAAAINRHLPQLGRWRTLRPRTQRHYFAWVISRTLRGRAIVANLDTEFLWFYHGKNLHHFNFVYGYNAVTQEVRVGEEWDPAYIYGRNPSAGNPYGKHWVPLREAFTAVNSSPIHGIVV